MKFKFRKTKDNLFIWENSEMKLEFSNPKITANDSFMEINSEEDILYFYYNVNIYKKDYIENSNKRDWVLVQNIRTHDFPCIEQLKYILDYMDNLDTSIEGQKIEFRSGKIEYRYTMQTEGFGCDDFYELTKVSNNKNDDIYYIFYFGGSFHFESDLNSCGIRTPYLNQEDINKLKKCVNEFLKYSIKIYNESTIHYIEINNNCKKIYNNKLYNYYYDYTTKSIDFNRIENIYCIGDKFDSINISYKVNGKYITEEINKDMTIIHLDKDIMTVEYNEQNIIKTKDIFINQIVFISEDEPTNKLNYNTTQIKDDFVSILNEEELNEFKIETEDLLFEKYSEAILNRTWMCRNEHDLLKLKKNKGYHENVYANIKYIIKEIKKDLNSIK